MSNLQSFAEDLDSFLAGIKKAAPRTETSGGGPGGGAVVITTIAKTEDAAPSYDEVVRATFDYVTSQLKEEDGPESIGEAFMVACSAVAKDAGLDEAKLHQHALFFLEGLVEAARGAL